MGMIAMAVVGVSVLWQVKTKFFAGRILPVHEHGFYHFFYIKAGKLNMEVDNRSFVLHPDEIALFAPDVPHGYSVPNDEDAIGLELKLLVDSPELLAMLESLPFSFPCTPSVMMTLQQLEAYVQNALPRSIGSDVYIGTVNSYASLLLYNVVEEHAAFLASQVKNEVAPVVERYVNEHYGEKILLDEFVPLLGHNKSYICALYKKERGFTINDYIKKVRINKACDLLSEGGYRMSEVAAACGFKTISHFSYTFKEVVGIPPSQFASIENPQSFDTANLSAFSLEKPSIIEETP